MIRMEIQRFKEPEYAVANAMNTLCTNLSFADGVTKMMLTSCQPQEGKSYIAMNLMRTMATSLGWRTILVDADIRASALRESFSIKVSSDSSYLGLSGYLSGRCEMEDIVGQTDIPGADLILAGKTVMNSLPLYNSSRMESLLEWLGARYDAVIVDAPPVGTIVDAAKIAAMCDGTLLVVASGEVRAGKLREAVSQIERAGCPIIGYVLNKSKARTREDSYYYYGKRAEQE